MIFCINNPAVRRSDYCTEAVRPIRIALGVGIFAYKGSYSPFLALFIVTVNIIPYVGQVIGTIPAAIFGLMVSPLTPIYVILGVAALNVIEGNLVKPFVFSKSIDFHPIIVFTLIMIGGQFFGVIGMILIIPIAGILKIIGRYMQ